MSINSERSISSSPPIIKTKEVENENTAASLCIILEREIQKISTEQSIEKDFSTQEIESFLKRKNIGQSFERAQLFFRKVSYMLSGEENELYVRLATIPWQKTGINNFSLYGGESEFISINSQLKKYYWRVLRYLNTENIFEVDGSTRKVLQLIEKIQSNEKLDFSLQRGKKNDYFFELFYLGKKILLLHINENSLDCSFDFGINNEIWNSQFQNTDNWQDQITIIQDWIDSRFSINSIFNRVEEIIMPSSLSPVSIDSGKQDTKGIGEAKIPSISLVDIMNGVPMPDKFTSIFPERGTIPFNYRSFNTDFIQDYLKVHADESTYLTKRKKVLINSLFIGRLSFIEILKKIGPEIFKNSQKLGIIISILEKILFYFSEPQVDIGKLDTRIIELAKEIDSLNELIYTNVNNKLQGSHFSGSELIRETHRVRSFFGWKEETILKKVDFFGSELEDTLKKLKKIYTSGNI